ncbi:DNA repair protein RecO [Commensalibacter sp. Nvir]|uniref:DNA repair protein RecO n=1 Tax=Commensalibacter sp. Nvir TaxID=3069817 RepID=UPI002D66ACCF|nr:DNA repair protein RecO [Commensalibacter sp. Nvir]
MLNWSSPCIILNSRLYGEVDGIVSVLSLEYGFYKGIVKAVVSRKQSPIWQVGNFVDVQWSARTPEQLGYFKGELVRPNFALISSKPFEFIVLSSACSIIFYCCFEHQPVINITKHLFRLITLLSLNESLPIAKVITEYVRWEMVLLSELGYGLDLSACMAFKEKKTYWVSPKTGKAVTEETAGIWKPRLFKMPTFCIDPEINSDVDDWTDGLNLTGYFLEKHVFNSANKTLPQARTLLIEKLKRE